ncbi:lipoate--protein ligase family protein [Tepidibacter thalassicus]|uniref:Lipoate-protein ligase A n=1 Tax=Tepidibacter thalassicus DSM 15285 TaxID=1123350 RepID=A0A1M5RFB0_9FIRM|nr:biotin/lipoate A/B protein ligase family protein [Tepidibacter thalassicus]SHH25062.1 lipoate-protein ligase A [Tepidibacter thalassicus DSM 15285]
MEKWRIIKNTTYNAYMNMAIDEAIMIAHREGKVEPTLRFYTWKPACISIGYFQKLEKEIDLDKCKELNIDYVRRTTGGRAVLHDDELTYSIVVRENHPLMDGGIIKSYKFISEGLCKGLSLCGVKTDELSRGERIGRENLSSACFNAHSAYEVTINNKKVIGSAQTRKDGIILQHGSIILNFDVNKLFSVIKIRDEKQKERLIRFTANKASGIENETKIKIDINILQENIVKALKEHFKVEFYECNLTEYEISIANELYKKYSSDEWNKKR